jgi:protein involved in polysaccharide export with SLBB domain
MNCGPYIHGVWFSRFARLGVRPTRCGGVLLAIALLSIPTAAQVQKQPRVQSSDLERENQSRVAASPAEIKVILVKDPGILVELKRWLAKDATDHGQMVRDSDLTDDAIFYRLETDIPFRSVATALVQKYGYLRPQLNPHSDIGKEHELLVQERAKWLAQEQEEERIRSKQQGLQELQRARACGQGSNANCGASPEQPPAAITSEQQTGSETSPLKNAPDEMNPPNLPRQEIPVDRAQITQTSEEYAEDFTQPPVGSSFGSNQPANNLSAGFSQVGFGKGNAGAMDSGGGLLAAASPLDERVQDASELPIDMSGASLGQLPDGSGINGKDLSLAPGNNAIASMASPNRRNPSRGASSPTEMVRKPNPYDDIPSLYDMYLQAVPRPAQPRRFGMEVFQNGVRDQQLIPMDLPVGPEYVVGPGDGLAIDLWGAGSRRFYRTVDREGRVSLPEVGPVLVSGKTLADVQQSFQHVLRTQFRDVSADVSLARLRTIRVYEVGDIAKPGAYDVSSLSTPLNALFVAGGPTERGSLRIVKHYRGNHLVQEVDLYDMLLHGVRGNIERLENGDSILVPPIGPQVAVEGMVRRPAIYELNGEKNLASVLELAGGLLPIAALRHIEVQRTIAHEKKTMLSFDIPEVDDGSVANAVKKLESFEIKDGDRIRVFPITPYNQDGLYLEGHVLRPGRYSYSSGMRVTDVIASYKDLLPEPDTQYAEIIRLNAPDFHPSVESFNLAEALANPGQAPALHPMDTIRVFSRFDFENPPVVSVWGDVRRPGTYRTSGRIRVADAVHLAGGLAPDAQTADAQVFRHLTDGKMKIFSVSLSGALEGDPTSDILLEPRDGLLIHRNPDAVEPASVYVQGDVAKPGRYPLTANMTIADLIKVGGGLKPSADPQTADLTRYQYDGSNLKGHNEAISISAALAGDPSANQPMNNGDVLTVRERPGWNDLGASITVKGEVTHPGPYGIRPGERLSSVLERAGGFQPSAYPYGAILERAQVRDLEKRQRDEMILRIKDSQTALEAMPEADPRQRQVKEAALQQYQATLTQLSANPPPGRVAIRISPDIAQWERTQNDIEVRSGDTLIIPKTPSYVMVTGQVFNPTAVSYRPGKSAKWYLGQSGGPTQMADKKAIFVIRADGTVIGSATSLWNGSSLGATLRPGDTVVVPEKAIGPGRNWQNIFAAAQVATSIASTVFIAAHY